MTWGRRAIALNRSLLTFFVLLAPQTLEGQRLTAESFERIVRAQVDSGFSGVVLVAQGDSVVLRRGYAHPGASPPSAASAFWIGSITKSFTAAAILRKREQHRLSLRESVAHVFPDAPVDKRGITIEQLLTHTAGFSATYSGGGIQDRASAVRAILSQPFAYAPGHGYRYGDDDYELLAAVLEIVSGHSWEDVIRQEVLEPAGLRHTGFWCAASRVADAPPGAACGGRDADWGHRGANGMSSTADDLLKWARVLHEDRGLLDLEVPHVVVRHEGSLDVAYGYGVRLYVKDGRVIEAMHAGSSDDGHSAVVRELASGMIIVVLSNAGWHEGTTWSSFVATRLAPRTR